MVKVSYVKFYQAVQVGKMLESFLGSKMSKNKNLELTYEGGILRIAGKGITTTFVPFSNIMYFHGEDEKKAK